jgi:predicted MPP superfamily phosphohydrolase
VHLSDLPPRPSAKAPSIELRRFAGGARHAQQLSHLRIAHLTDLHFGRVTPLAVQRAAVDLTNAQAPDLVVITGDFVCHSQMFLDQLVAELARLEAPTLGVLGNHDYWSGADEVANALRRANVEVLRNQWTERTVRGERLQIIGLDDAYTGHADRDAALRGVRPELASIGLSHIAEEADAMWARGVPLVFAGHTHAGQVTLARLHELALGKLVGHKYVHGLYGTRAREGTEPGAIEGAVYVGAGIGAAVMPIRLGERGRRELAIFELGADAEVEAEHHTEQVALAGRKPSEALTEKRRAAVHKKMWKREMREAKRTMR